MTEEAVPERTEPAHAPAQPAGLLQQMEELMAALNADLSRLDADLWVPRPTPADTAAGASQDSPTDDTATSPADTPASGAADGDDSS